jgi:hypothetical protein
LTYTLGWAVENVGCGNLETKTHIRQTRGNHDNPHNLNGGDGEDGETAFILEGETDKQDTSLSNVLGEQVKNELLNVVEHAAALFDGVENGGKVVVSQNNVGSVLGDIRASTHSDTNVGAFERWRIVDTVTGHGRECLSAVQSVNHADLCVRRTTSNDKRKQGESVDFVVRQLVKLGGGHNHRISDILCERRHVRRQNANFGSNSASSSGVVTSKHVNFDSSLLTLADRSSSLRSGRIIETNQSTEDQFLFDTLPVEVFTLGWHRSIVVFACKRQDTKSVRGKCFHVGQNLLAVVVVHCIGGLTVGIEHRVAGVDDTLNSTLGEDELLGARGLLENDRHLLDIGVEGEFRNLLPSRGIAGRELQTVPLETGCEDLNGDLSRVTSCVPLTIGLVHVCQVSQGGNLEVFNQMRVVFEQFFVSLGLLVHVGVDVTGFLGCEAKGAYGRVVGLLSNTDRVSSLGGDPRPLCNHLSLGECTSLVRADISDTTKSLERLQVADNDVSLHHTLGTGSHGDCQDYSKRGGDHTETGGNSVDDDFAVVGEGVGCQDNDGTNNGSTKEQNRETSQLLLKGRANVDAQEGTDSVTNSQSPCLGISVWFGGSVLLALYRADAGALLAEGHGDGSDFSVHSCSKDNTSGTTLGDCGRAECDVQTIAGASVFVENRLSIFRHWKRLTSEKSLVGFKVDSFDDAA